MDLDYYKKMNIFQPFEDYIRKFILEDNDLFKFIFYAQQSPLLQPDEENPYRIFDASENNEHGVVLFGRKNNAILNTSTVILLVDFEITNKGSLREYNNVSIIFRIILKGDIQKLENGLDRAFIIDKLLENNFNRANINGLGYITKKSTAYTAINEENNSYMSIYKGNVFSCDDMNNKNFLKKIGR